MNVCEKAEMTFRPARPGEEAAVMALYHSLIGTPFCAWDDTYPNPACVADDVKNEALYVLDSPDGLIAAGAFRYWPEHDPAAVWTSRNPCDLARFGVAHEWQGRGIGRFFLLRLLEAAKERGFDGMRILVAATNLPAERLYRRAGAEYRSDFSAYDILWHCYEIGFRGKRSGMKKNILIGLLLPLALGSLVAPIYHGGCSDKVIYQHPQHPAWMGYEPVEPPSAPLFRVIPEVELQNVLRNGVTTTQCRQQLGRPTFHVIGMDSQSYIYLYDGKLLSPQDEYVGFAVVFDHDRFRSWTWIRSDYRCYGPAQPEIGKLLSVGMSLQEVKTLLGEPAMESRQSDGSDWLLYLFALPVAGEKGVTVELDHGRVSSLGVAL